MLTGRVRKYHSNFYYVEADGVLYECALRGLLKKEGTEVLVGDRVTLDNVDEANRTARVVDVLERRNAITRPKMANIDQVIVVYSMREPDFDPHQLDRYLTHVELAGLSALICLSKVDLADSQDELEEIQAMYQHDLKYPVLLTSVHQPASLKPIRQAAQGKVSVLAGPSGAGKSSLLNALDPSLKLRVGDISERISRGQHTTRHVELLALEDDMDIADTPGFSNLKFNYVMPEQVEAAFRDFAPYRDQCAFSDCLHLAETHSAEDCAVLAHLDAIQASRYESYLAILAEAMQYKQEAQVTSQKQEDAYKKLDRKGKEVKILRLGERDRDASRRTQRQKVSLLEQEEDWDESDSQAIHDESDENEIFDELE